MPALSSVRWLLVRIVGEARVREIGTPYLYERPYLLTGITGLGSGLLLFGLGLGILRRIPKTGRGSATSLEPASLTQSADASVSAQGGITLGRF